MIADTKKTIGERLKILFDKENSKEDSYRPVFFNLSDQEDIDELNNLLTQNPSIQVFDELQSQLEELVKSINPQVRFKKEQLKEAVNEYLTHEPNETDGVWVYYPWLLRLIHILDEENFVNLRTNRNLYKITHEEREILSKQKIGIVGLSVGNSIALTMVMERMFGEIRIADFDTLELTNLNRIRTGVHNLGLPKVISTAREIMEIDPFMNVICYHEGLTEENMTDFLTKGGKLNILVEECDSLDIKILSRVKAKELGIPVVMDTSDRGMIDIERFDLEPDRPILHGFIKDIDVSSIKNLTAEEKIPIVLSMVGIDKISERMKASMIEVEQTITSWPQLASSVVLGGGITVDVCRRIALGQFHESGRYYIDLETLIKDSSKETESDRQHDVRKDYALKLDEFVLPGNLVKDNSGKCIHLDQTTVEDLLKAAISAPTGGNCQPWKWVYQDKTLSLFHDMERSIAFLDYENMGSYIGLGTAAENLILKAHSFNLDVVMNIFPLKEDKRLAATFKFLQEANDRSNQYESHECDHLVGTIEKRLTNRKFGPRQTIDSSELENLVNIARTIPGADLKIIDNEKDITALGEIIASVDRLLITNKEGHRDYINEIRWTPEEAETTRDGVDIATVDLSAAEIAGFKLARNWAVVKYISYWKQGSAFEKMARKSVASASAMGLITMPEFNSLNYFNGGRALERVWLAANKADISFQPLTPALFLFARLKYGKGEGMDEHMIKELTDLRKQFLDLMSIYDNLGEVLLFRLCKAVQPEVKSLRRPLNDVFTYRN